MKLKVVMARTSERFEEQLNEWADKGYKVLSASVNYNGEWFLAIMERDPS